MELKKNQVVIFEDGHQEGNLEARWSERNQAFVSYREDGSRMYSTEVIDKPSRKKAERGTFVPSRETCNREIVPEGETEKAYMVCTGYLGGNRVKYGWVAKSVCYVDETGKVFAPAWALK